MGSYAADKRLDVSELRYERIDVATGAVLTGVIGAFVIIACAATLHATGRSIDDARDAATALAPVAGSAAATLFGLGLLGAALLAASVVPLSTAYSVSEAVGHSGRLDDSWRSAPVFYGVYAGVTVLAAVLVLIPGAPLVQILYLTQALNAVLLLPLLWIVRGLARDRELMGERALHGVGDAAAIVAFVAVGASVVALAWLTVA
jgi:Mn2+/Fe2+ NRAMP family transporter